MKLCWSSEFCAGRFTPSSCVEHIKELTNLKLLNLGERGITDEGVAKLQKALPNCKILH